VVAGGGEGEGFAPPADLDIAGLVFAFWRLGRRQVGQAGQEVPEGFLRSLLPFRVAGGLCLQGLDFGEQASRLCFILGRLGLTDPSGEFIAPGLRRLGGGFAAQAFS